MDTGLQKPVQDHKVQLGGYGIKSLAYLLHSSGHTASSKPEAKAQDTRCSVEYSKRVKAPGGICIPEVTGTELK